MKTKFYLCLLVPLLIIAYPGFPANIYKHQIIQSEADELNKPGDALSITGTGWPISGELILFTGLPNLKILDLSDNNLTSINKDFRITKSREGLFIGQ